MKMAQCGRRVKERAYSIQGEDGGCAEKLYAEFKPRNRNVSVNVLRKDNRQKLRVERLMSR